MAMVQNDLTPQMNLPISANDQFPGPPFGALKPYRHVSELQQKHPKAQGWFRWVASWDI